MHPAAKLLSIIDHVLSGGELHPTLADVILMALSDPTTCDRGVDLAGQLLDVFIKNMAAQRVAPYTSREFIAAMSILLMAAVLTTTDFDGGRRNFQ